MEFLLPHDRYDDIRYALDPTLDASGVPDELIESTAYLPLAERAIRARDTLAESRSGDEQELLFTSIILKTAALLSYAVPQVRQTNMAGHTATLAFAETALQRAARLNAESESTLELYLATVGDLAALAPIFVTTVSGSRA